MRRELQSVAAQGASVWQRYYTQDVAVSHGIMEEVRARAQCNVYHWVMRRDG